MGDIMTLITEVRDCHGAPALFFDGEPQTGLMFWHSRLAEAGEDIANFAGAGVRLFTGGFDAARGWREDGTFDFSYIDRQMAIILAANPAALVLPRVGVEPPGWWLERYPEERQLHLDIGNGDPFRWRVSFASTSWREAMAAPLTAYIRYCEELFGDRIFGYHLCAGDCGEWSYAWKPVMSDFSAPQHAGFRAWLRTRYATDDAIQQAWHDPAVTRDTAEIPRDRTRPASVWPRPGSLYDPARERQQIDYARYHSAVVAEAAVHFCHVAKTALTDLGRRKVCGIFYGYHFFDAGAKALHNCGHHALDAVLASPDVDFICAPESYQERQPGGMYLAQLPAASLRLHGKLYYNEDDTFTHLARPTPWRYCCPDAETTNRLLRRNLLGVLRDGGTQWWMDHDGEGWYRDPALLAEIDRLRRFTEAHLAGDRHSSAQVAVIVSEASQAFLRYDTALSDALLARQISELAHIGAPFDVYRSADLERLFAQPESARYRLIIFLDAIYLSPAEREAIRARVAVDGRTLLWVHAAGLATENGLSEDAQASVTGIRVARREQPGALKVEAYLNDLRLTYGTDREIAPVLVGDDPSAVVWGWELHRGAPGLLVKAMPGWRSVWSAAPALPAMLLREIARQAGVHLYAPAGDQVFAMPGWLAFHAGRDGARDITFPAPVAITDAFTGAAVAEAATTVHVTLPRGETVVWRVE